MPSHLQGRTMLSTVVDHVAVTISGVFDTTKCTMTSRDFASSVLGSALPLTWKTLTNFQQLHQ